MSPGQSPLEGSAIHEGWLRKSPPFESPNLLFRPRWRKRWMVLVQAPLDTELYILHYFTDETKSKLKGSINLRHCMSISSNSVLETDKKSKQVKLVLSSPLPFIVKLFDLPPTSPILNLKFQLENSKELRDDPETHFSILLAETELNALNAGF